MNRRVYLASLGSVATAGLAGCSSVLETFGSDEPCTGDSCDIGMSRNAFIPREYETTVGETVIWNNTSDANHTVTAFDAGIPDDAEYFASGGFEDEQAARDAWHSDFGGELTTRETYEHTFEVAGTYNYVCIPHELASEPMVGTVIVEE